MEEDSDAGFDPNTVLRGRISGKVDRFILVGLAAAEEALAQAQWAPVSEADRLRTARSSLRGPGSPPSTRRYVRSTGAASAAELPERTESHISVRPLRPPGTSHSRALLV